MKPLRFFFTWLLLLAAGSADVLSPRSDLAESSLAPAAGSHVNPIRRAGQLFHNGMPSPDDISQTCRYTCWMAAILMAMAARKPQDLIDRLSPTSGSSQWLTQESLSVMVQTHQLGGRPSSPHRVTYSPTARYSDMEDRENGPWWVAAFEAAITREVCGTTLKDLHSGDISQLQSEESLTALWRAMAAVSAGQVTFVDFANEQMYISQALYRSPRSGPERRFYKQVRDQVVERILLAAGTQPVVLGLGYTFTPSVDEDGKGVYIPVTEYDDIQVEGLYPGNVYWVEQSDGNVVVIKDPNGSDGLAEGYEWSKLKPYVGELTVGQVIPIAFPSSTASVLPTATLTG